jgi:hypothetical protein
METHTSLILVDALTAQIVEDHVSNAFSLELMQENGEPFVVDMPRVAAHDERF